MNHKTLSSSVVETISAKILLLLTAFIFCLLYCPFSPYGDLVKEYDFACFFMAGKAWYFGYVPYIDFIDVKGPLLFLLFKIGYALSPGSTVGTFALFIVILFLTLVFVQLTMKLYLKNELLSSLGTILILSLRVLPALSLYGRAEDIIALPIVISIFCGAVYFKNSTVSKNLALFSCSLGACCALVFLVKFNVCLYFFGISSATAIVLILKKRWGDLVRFCSFGFAAFFFTLSPFVVYMHLKDILDDFISVYFQLNMVTYERMGYTRLTKVLYTFALRLVNNIYIVPVVLYLVTSALKNNHSHLFSKDEKIYFLVSAIFLFFVGCGAMIYYMIVCCFAVIPLIIVVLHRLSTSLLLNKGLTLCFASVLPLWISCYNDKALAVIQRLRPNNPNVINYSIDNILENDKHAKLMYYNSLDMGFGVKGESLPAFPYWMRLNGLPDREHNEMQTAIQNHLADYVIVYNAKETASNDFLEKAGYKLVDTCRIPERIDLWKLAQDEQREEN